MAQPADALPNAVGVGMGRHAVPEAVAVCASSPTGAPAASLTSQGTCTAAAAAAVVCVVHRLSLVLSGGLHWLACLTCCSYVWALHAMRGFPGCSTKSAACAGSRDAASVEQQQEQHVVQACPCMGAGSGEETEPVSWLQSSREVGAGGAGSEEHEAPCRGAGVGASHGCGLCAGVQTVQLPCSCQCGPGLEEEYRVWCGRQTNPTTLLFCGFNIALMLVSVVRSLWGGTLASDATVSSGVQAPNLLSMAGMPPCGTPCTAGPASSLHRLRPSCCCCCCCCCLC